MRAVVTKNCPAPAAPLERLGGEQRRAAAVVERQQHLWRRPVRVERADLQAGRGHGIEVGLEHLRLELVASRQRARKADRLTLCAGCDVVVHECAHLLGL